MSFFANPAIGRILGWPKTNPDPSLTTAWDRNQRPKATRRRPCIDWGSSGHGRSRNLPKPPSTLRFVKDEYEIAQMREAVRITVAGFAEVARSIPQATKQTRGERVVETAFYSVGPPKTVSSLATKQSPPAGQMLAYCTGQETMAKSKLAT